MKEMKPTTLIGLAALVVVGVIVAKVVTSPKGTRAAGQQGNKFWKTSVHGLLGRG